MRVNIGMRDGDGDVCKSIRRKTEMQVVLMNSTMLMLMSWLGRRQFAGEGAFEFRGSG